MNTTSRAILQTVLATDTALAPVERNAIQQLVDGRIEEPATRRPMGERLLLTQKNVATLLSVSRVTVWRLTKDSVLHPVEIMPGTWRYPLDEVENLSRSGWKSDQRAPVAIPQRLSA